MCSFCRMWTSPARIAGEVVIGKEAYEIKRENADGALYALPELMAMDVKHAKEACQDLKTVRQRLQVLEDLGLGYLTLGEATPSLSGGEAQRLKLASGDGPRQQDTSVFVFDEPTIGLHPLDVQTLLQVFQTGWWRMAPP